MKAQESQTLRPKSSKQQARKSLSPLKPVGLQKRVPERESRRGQAWCVWQDTQAQKASCLTLQHLCWRLCRKEKRTAFQKRPFQSPSLMTLMWLGT